MLRQLEQKFLIQPIIDQILCLDFGKRIALNETAGNLFNGPFTIKPEFKGTPLGEVLDSLGEIGEARLMRLSAGESYMAHSDPDDRIQMAILTNPYSYLIDLEKEKMYHLPADGTLWYMDTGPRHIAANFGSRDRLHLNVRMLLPSLKENPVHIKMLGGDYDFEYVIHTNMSAFMNRAIKNGDVTGFQWLNDREIIITYREEKVLEDFKLLITSTGLQYEISPV